MWPSSGTIPSVESGTGSMYGIFTGIWLIFLNKCRYIYQSHGLYGSDKAAAWGGLWWSWGCGRNSCGLYRWCESEAQLQQRLCRRIHLSSGLGPPRDLVVYTCGGLTFLFFKSWICWRWCFTSCQGKSSSGWWFQIFFIFTPIWGRFPFWLIFSKWVETTN